MDESAHVLSGVHSLMAGGGGEGIGRAVTRALAAGGSAVAVADNDSDRADEAASEVTAAGGRAVSLTGDARFRDDVEGLVQRATDDVRR
jgi:3-oxoacyl-[acyl-carrier protein] reductase